MSQRRKWEKLLWSCEWCGKTAIWHLIASPKYSRFSCEEHLSKTKRTAFLDGNEVATTVFNSGGFRVVNYE